MSVSLILVPLAVAAVTAIQARADRAADGRVVCQVQTRMRDASLLAAALRETGAAVTGTDDEIAADWDGVRAAFARTTDGVWTAHFTGQVDEARAVEMVTALDAAYGRQVQAAVLRRLRDRAPAAGLRLESESRAEDASVRMVFAVERPSA